MVSLLLFLLGCIVAGIGGDGVVVDDVAVSYQYIQLVRRLRQALTGAVGAVCGGGREGCSGWWRYWW